MTVQIKLYEYSTSRVKFKEKFKTTDFIKRNLIEKNGSWCYLCKKEFNFMRQLELKHLIPVEVGGHLFESNNVNLDCRSYQLEKDSNCITKEGASDGSQNN